MIVNCQNFYTISDVHVDRPGGNEELKFVNFLNQCIEDKVEVVFLLGDIFNVIAGADTKYFEKYKLSFEAFDRLIGVGTRIIYLQGNHEFHLEKLINKRYPENLFQYVKEDIKVITEKNEFYLCHGDEIEIGNQVYMLYKKFMNSQLMKYIVNNVLGYNSIELIGSQAASSSRYYSSNFDINAVREKFRKSAYLTFKDITSSTLICGHSHIVDDFIIEVNGVQKRYINNGFFPKSNQYIAYINDQLDLTPIE